VPRETSNLSARKRTQLDFEQRIGNLTHRFLSSIDEDESARIASELIAAIRELVDLRRGQL